MLLRNVNHEFIQNAKETAGLLGSLSCGLLMLSPMVVILLCLLILAGAVITGGH